MFPITKIRALHCLKPRDFDQLLSSCATGGAVLLLEGIRVGNS